jgi:hypothetical protein
MKGNNFQPLFREIRLFLLFFLAFRLFLISRAIKEMKEFQIYLLPFSLSHANTACSLIFCQRDFEKICL